MRPLNDLERKVLKALTDEFMSASVVQARAKISMILRVSPIVKACAELEKRGLAERSSASNRATWRRANDTTKAYDYQN